MDRRYQLERFLQRLRFAAARPYIKEPVLDVGGNCGELGNQLGLVDYFVCNNIERLPGGKWRTITLLATLEHLTCDASWLFGELGKRLASGGRLVVSTPNLWAHPVIRLLAQCRLLDPQNAAGHICYWSAVGLTRVAESCGFTLALERSFEFGFNQLLVYGWRG